MNNLSIRMLALIATIGLSSAANAIVINDSYFADRVHYTIYNSGTSATMPFTVPSSVPNTGAVVTSVSYQWRPYPNGNISEIVELCYTPKYATNPPADCVNITAEQSDINTDFAGRDAKGQFWIRHTIIGGTYPAYPSSVRDEIIVDYWYNQ